MITVSLNLPQILLAAIMIAATCAAVTVAAARWYNRGHWKLMRLREKQVQEQWRIIAAQRTTRRDRDNALRVREEFLAEQEREFGRRTREAAATIRREEESFDTMVSRELSPLHHPFEDGDTVAIPAIEE